jgi:uncharacterized protein YjbI with pentapeptide repeats
MALGLVPVSAVAVCVAGVAFGSIDLHSVWQVWHLATSDLIRSCQDGSLWSWRNCLWPHIPHNNFTHNSFTQLSHTQLSHTISLPPSPRYSRTQLSHTQLTPTALSHTTLSYAPLSHNLSSTISTQPTHTFSHTTCSHTTLSQATLSLDLSSIISFLCPAFPIPSSAFFCYLL